jgi:hypothetical protein
MTNALHYFAVQACPHVTLWSGPISSPRIAPQPSTLAQQQSSGEDFLENDRPINKMNMLTFTHKGSHHTRGHEEVYLLGNKAI